MNKFLQNKMHIEMEKFNVVETAFKNIKIATGVLDGPTMVTRYIEKEKIYGRLLDSIAKSEKEIDKLNEVRDGLLREKKELEAEIAQSDANLNKGSQSLNGNKIVTQSNIINSIVLVRRMTNLMFVRTRSLNGLAGNSRKSPTTHSIKLPPLPLRFPPPASN